MSFDVRPGDIASHCEHLTPAELYVGEGVWYESHEVSDDPIVVELRGRSERVKWLVVCIECDAAFSLKGGEARFSSQPVVVRRGFRLNMVN